MSFVRILLANGMKKDYSAGAMSLFRERNMRGTFPQLPHEEMHLFENPLTFTVRGTPFVEGFHFFAHSTSGHGGSERRRPHSERPGDIVARFTRVYQQRDHLNELQADRQAKIELTDQLRLGMYALIPAQQEQPYRLIELPDQKPSRHPPGDTRNHILDILVQRNQHNEQDSHTAAMNAWGSFIRQVVTGRIAKIQEEEGGQAARWRSEKNPTPLNFDEGVSTDYILAQWTYENMRDKGVSEKEAIDAASIEMAEQILDGTLEPVFVSTGRPPLWRSVETQQATDIPSNVSRGPSRRTVLIAALSGAGILLLGGTYYFLVYGPSQRVNTGQNKPPTPQDTNEPHASPTPLLLEGTPFTGTPTHETLVMDSTNYDIYSVQMTIPSGHSLILSLLNDPQDKTTQTIAEVGGLFTSVDGPTQWKEFHQAFPPPEPLDRGATYYKTRILVWDPTSQTERRYAFFLLRVPKGHHITGAFDLRVADPSQVAEILNALPSNYPELKGTTPLTIPNLAPTCPGVGPLSPDPPQQCQ